MQLKLNKNAGPKVYKLFSQLIPIGAQIGLEFDPISMQVKKMSDPTVRVRIYLESGYLSIYASGKKSEALQLIVANTFYRALPNVELEESHILHKLPADYTIFKIAEATKR